jgi:hypothetical protein
MTNFTSDSKANLRKLSWAWGPGASFSLSLSCAMSTFTLMTQPVVIPTVIIITDFPILHRFIWRCPEMKRLSFTTEYIHLMVQMSTRSQKATIRRPAFSKFKNSYTGVHWAPNGRGDRNSVSDEVNEYHTYTDIAQVHLSKRTHLRAIPNAVIRLNWVEGEPLHIETFAKWLRFIRFGPGYVTMIPCQYLQYMVSSCTVLAS